MVFVSSYLNILEWRFPDIKMQMCNVMLQIAFKHLLKQYVKIWRYLTKPINISIVYASFQQNVFSYHPLITFFRFNVFLLINNGPIIK